jgi:hypothetical protein
MTSNTKAASERARQLNSSEADNTKNVPTNELIAAHTLLNAAESGYLEWRSTQLYEKRQR